MSRLTRIALGSLFLPFIPFGTYVYRGPTVSPALARSLAAPLLQDSLTATVRRIGPDGLDVITGVQFNIELTHFVVDSASVIRKGEQVVALEALQPGDLVDIQYRETDAGRLAERIEVRPPGRGHQR